MGAWRCLAVVLGVAVAVSAKAAPVDVPTVPDGIAGVVTSAKGPEAGVWVIAETKDLPTPYVKIVVTDDQGRYVLPDLPKAGYSVWVRGYGLSDSKPQPAKPGARLDLVATVAASPVEAAQIYPANYWFSLLHPPGDDMFPGTGREGNGFAPTLKSANDWIVEMKEGCLPCHQLGTRATRTLAETPSSFDAWDKRVQMARSEDDVTLGGSATVTGAAMSATMSHLGRPGSLKVFSDWTDRIAKGEVPEAPPRPTGIERNVVLTIADWGMGEFVHSTASTDRRDPTINANGLIYGGNVYHGNLVTYDPVSHVAKNIPAPKSQPPRERDAAPVVHNPMVDRSGRVWIAEIPSATGKPEPAYCSDGKQSPFAAYYPIEGERRGHEVIDYDPKTKKFELFDYCVNTQIPVFLHDKDNTVAFSGMNSVISWIDTKVWDETHDAAKAIGWCPIVVDTNGDGKIDPDRNAWNVPTGGGNDGSNQNAMGEGGNTKLAHGVKGFDPKRDTQISGYWYGVGVNPQDDSIWAVKFTPYRQSGIVRLERGAHPPETCKGEYYEPPKRPDGLYAAYNARGVELDSKGVAWVAFGSGQIGRFDRSKCKTLNGPAAGTGQGCPEGWTIYDTPGPKLGGVGTADWHYMAWVDLYDASGLGKDVPLITGTISDSIKAVMPGDKIISLRVPYPLSFFTRYIDARIDDPNTGWKGRGIWAAYAQVPQWHIEGGEGTTSKIVHFQIRPDPLAH